MRGEIAIGVMKHHERAVVKRGKPLGKVRIRLGDARLARGSIGGIGRGILGIKAGKFGGDCVQPMLPVRRV